MDIQLERERGIHRKRREGGRKEVTKEGMKEGNVWI
jgi:hypothetical protein